MSAIEACRTAVMGGHVAGCDDCAQLPVACNSCRNRHCPKRQGAAAMAWLGDREADLLPVAYYHVVFTLPAAIGAIAYQNKAVVYDILFKTLRTIAADPKHLGAWIGVTSVLHTWDSALTHHPHVHRIVPGGGLSPDGERWIACRMGVFLPVRVLSRLFLEKLGQAHAAGRLAFFNDLSPLAKPAAFEARIAPLRAPSGWPTPSARGGTEAVLAYLARYTHRIAIANSRLVTLDDHGVTFRWKDYRARDMATGKEWIKTMTLPADEFLRRFLLHVLPGGFPPHPPPRPSRQRPARRQHRPHQKTDRRDRDRSDTPSRRRSRSIRHRRAPLSLLQRAHAYRPDLRPRPNPSLMADLPMTD